MLHTVFGTDTQTNGPHPAFALFTPDVPHLTPPAMRPSTILTTVALALAAAPVLSLPLNLDL